MNFILRTAPSFLRKADAYLRINHSWIWATKIHIHLYMTLILGFVFSLVGLFYHIELTDVPQYYNQNTFFMIMFVPAVLFLLYMLFNMSLFNPDKSFAYRFRYQEFFLFLIWFLTFCLPLVIPYSASMILNERIANLVDDKQFEKEKQQFNEGLPFIPVSTSNYSYYPSDSVYLYEVTHTRQESSTTEDEYNYWSELEDSIASNTGIYVTDRPKLYFSHSRMWSNERYYRYGYGRRYQAIDSAYQWQEYLKDSLYSMYIHRTNLVKDKSNAARHIMEMDMILRKYYMNYAVDPQLLLARYMDNNYKPVKDMDIWFDIVERNIDSISDAKNKRTIAWHPDVFQGLLLFVFCLTLLFLVFKNVHWKQFLLSAAVAAGLMTLIVIIEVIAYTKGQTIATIGLLFPTGLLVMSGFGFSLKKFNWMFNTVVVLLTLILPFYPLIIVGYLAEYQGLFTIGYFDQFKEYSITAAGERVWEYSTAYYECINTIWLYTLWTGLLLYLFFWNSYLKLLYLRFWALPKNR